MTVIEIKTEINRLLDTVPEETLNEILNLLKTPHALSTNDEKFLNSFKKIVEKNRGLLQRLAQ